MKIIFAGRRALVTGAGTGMGRATALKLAELGAQVVALGDVEVDLESLKAEEPRIETLCQDLTKFQETRKTIEKICPINMLVNCAGVFSSSPFLKAPLQEFDRVFAVNVKGLVNVTQAVAGDLVARGGTGTVVNVASLASYRGFWGASAYAASKSAVDSYTKSLALELAPKGVRVSSVSPTLVLTSMGQEIAASTKGMVPGLVGRTPVGRLAAVEDVVHAVVFLLSDHSSMVVGHNLPLDGGFLCV